MSQTSDAVRHRQAPESGRILDIDNHSLPVILTLILLLAFFIGFFVVYFIRCLIALIRRNHAGNTIVNTEVKKLGLDPSIVVSFPTVIYSSVKDLREGKSGRLECAVCLSEFQDNDNIRLLPSCDHAFHTECIDLWFESHTTCPVCRRNLDPSENAEPEMETEPEMEMRMTREGENVNDDEHSHVIDVHEEIEDEESDDNAERRRRSRGEEGVSGDLKGNEGVSASTEKFSRSHTTGHSIVRGDDRFRLRLPEHVKERITRGHNLTVSCITFGEFSGDTVAGKDGVHSGFPGGDVTMAKA